MPGPATQEFVTVNIGAQRGGGGKGGGGRMPPRPPRGDDLWDFLEFVYSLLETWTVRAGDDKGEFNLDSVTRAAIQDGWGHFSQQWNLHKSDLRTAVRKLDPADLDKRGLLGPALHMKLHLVRTRLDRLRGLMTTIRGFLPETRLVVRKSWHKLFRSVDTILDSVVNAVPLVGNGLASGLKEFKEFSLDVTEPD